MASDDKFLELLNQLAHAHTVQTDDAFERGREAGRREALAHVKRQLTGLTDLFGADSFGDEELGPGAEAGIEEVLAAGVDEHEGRAPPGSVKPIISNLIHSRPGLTTVEIRAITKLKPNSIRGTLWVLSAQDKAIERRNGRWHPTRNGDEVKAGADTGDAEAQTNEAAGDMSMRDTPTASVEDAGNGIFS